MLVEIKDGCRVIYRGQGKQPHVEFGVARHHLDGRWSLETERWHLDPIDLSVCWHLGNDHSECQNREESPS